MKKILAPKMEKPDYVRKKNLVLRYKPKESMSRSFELKYSLLSVLKRINEAHAWTSGAARWILFVCHQRKMQLSLKAQELLVDSEVSNETKLRLLGLRNWVFGFFILDSFELSD